MKIVVLTGGDSPEREVALASGECITKALRSRGHQVIEIDTARGAKQLPQDVKLLPDGIRPQPPKLEELPAKHGELAVEAMRTSSMDGVDVVFVALHGGQGEDGTIQGLLDLVGVPYTGSGVLASALAMDKTVSKRIFEQVGVRTPPWMLVHWDKNPSIDEVAERIEKSFGFPVAVKPSNQGSTVGFSAVQYPDQLEVALRTAAVYGNEILIEKFIEGRELTVAILEDRALPVVEIHPEHGVYDYECKYTKGKSRYSVPAEIPAEVTAEIQAQALKAYHALKCEGYARIDFRLGTDNFTYCLEVNTLPGMTETSLVPKAARAVGIEFPELCERIARLALQKKSKKKK